MPSKPKKTSEPKAEKEKKPAKAARSKKTVSDSEAAPKKTKSGVSKKKGSEPSIVKARAEKRDSSEAGSIAPPTSHLVSAFDLFKRKSGPSRQAPTVARMAPSTGFKGTPNTVKENPPANPAPAVQAPQSQAPKPAVEPPKKTVLPVVGASAPVSEPAKTLPNPSAPPKIVSPVQPKPIARPAPVPAKPQPKPQVTPKPAPSIPAPVVSPAVPVKPAARVLEIPSIITVRELAEKPHYFNH